MDTSVATGVQVLYAYSDTLQGLAEQVQRLLDPYPADAIVSVSHSVIQTASRVEPKLLGPDRGYLSFTFSVLIVVRRGSYDA